MGLLDAIFGARANKTVQAVGYRTLTELDPVFTSYKGALYEQELTRSAIQRFSDACAKLKPEVRGVETLDESNFSEQRASRMSNIQKIVKTQPNDKMTWPAFLARAANLYQCDDTLFIVPVFKRDLVTVDGFYPLKCETAEVVEYKGEPWVRFYFASGDVTALEMKYVAIVSRFQYWSDFFGESNCLDDTMQLIHAQSEAQQNAIRNGAKIRFIGKLSGQVREEDMEKKRERFVKDNLTAENNGGMMLYDQTFAEVKQIEPQSYTMSTDESERIEKNVYNYFGINEDILQNKYSEDVWGAWYEGSVEPFALKLGEALTKLVYTPTQQIHGHRIEFSSNRLEYASNASKRNMVRDMVDRGIMSLNEGREVLQMPPVKDGDVRVIRGEYLNSTAVSDIVSVSGGGYMVNDEDDNDRDLGGDDDIYNDSDSYGKDDF